MSDAQRFHELTGGCWHERDWSKEPVMWVGGKGTHCLTCVKCKQPIPMDYVSNRPTYDNAANILTRMKEFCGEGLEDFIVEVGGLSKHGSHLDTILVDYVLHPDDLLQKAIEWLEAEDEKA